LGAPGMIVASRLDRMALSLWGLVVKAFASGPISARWGLCT
jgi:hypothetical protein